MEDGEVDQRRALPLRREPARRAGRARVTRRAAAPLGDGGDGDGVRDAGVSD